MAAPFPPQGEQKQHTERPIKIYAEQYRAADPLPVGATTAIAPPIFPNGEPRVYTETGTFLLRETDWVISNRFTGAVIEVISAEEFAERFGPSTEIL